MEGAQGKADFLCRMPIRRPCHRRSDQAVNLFALAFGEEAQVFVNRQRGFG
jgi:hypothetical protein